MAKGGTKSDGTTGRMAASKAVAKKRREGKVTRVIEMRIDKVVEGGTWQDLQRLLYAGFKMTTLACNVAVGHLLRNDSELGPPIDDQNAYKATCAGVRHAREKAAEARAYCDRKKLPAPADCDLPSSVVAVLSKSVERHYNRHRSDMWAGRRQPTFFKYPAPYPQRANEFKGGVRMRPMACVPEGASDEEREAKERFSFRPCVTLLFGSRETKDVGGGVRRFVVALGGGKGWERQLAVFRRVAADAQAVEAGLKTEDDPDVSIIGDAQITARRCGADAGRSGGEMRQDGGSRRVPLQFMVSMSVSLPAESRPESRGTLLLTTDRDALWVATHDGRSVRPWVLNGDECAGWLERNRRYHRDHKARLVRISQDMKVERRTRSGGRRKIKDVLGRMCSKHARQMKTFLGQCAAGIVNYCVRNRISDLVYDDTERGWCDPFPWHGLRQELRSRCLARGIRPLGAIRTEESCVSPEES